MDYVARTGFATVSKNIVKELKKHFGQNLQLDIVAINYFGEPYYEDENTFVVPARTNDVNDDPFGRYFFLKMLNESNVYDGIFICQDLGTIVSFVEVLEHIKAEKKQNNKKSFKSIFYFPIDSKIVYELTRNLEFFDLLVTYTEYARNEILRFRPELKSKLKVIPHGNCSKDFYPIEDIKSFRKEFFKENSEKFIITNVNRNQPRKDIPSTIFAFIEAKKIWNKQLPEPFLYLHMHPKDPMGWDIRGIMLQTDLVEDVDYKLLPKEFEDSMVDTEMLNKIYNSCDAFISTTLGEGWGLCLHPSSKVLMSDGVKSIKDVQKGDFVMTNSGSLNKVLDTTNRKVTSYIEVKTKYGYIVKATHEHPYYSLKNNKVEWRKISDLDIKDYLSIVKPNGGDKLSGEIDLLQYFPLNHAKEYLYDDKYIYHKYGYSPKDKLWSISSICEKYNCTKKVVENAIAYISNKKEKVSERSYNLSEKLILDGFEKIKPLKIKRYIKISDDLLYVFGWYLAEGSCENGKRLEFSMGIDEIEDANKIATIICKEFGIKEVIVRKMKTQCAVRVSNTALAIIFKELFGDCALNKRVPKILFDHKKSLMPMIDAYIKGDGHISLNSNLINFTTISTSLAFQIQSILASNSIFLSIREIEPRNFSIYKQYICTIAPCHLRRYMDLVAMDGKLDREGKRNSKPYFIETNTHFFIPIISIKEIVEEVDVYDLCVENSHSFIANGIVCHNTYSEAASCKLPIIAPYSASFIEMSNYGKNAYMLENLYPVCQINDNVIREQIDIYEAAETLNHVAMAKNKLLEDINAYENLTKRIEDNYKWVKSLEWSIVCKQWIEYFKIY